MVRACHHPDDAEEVAVEALARAYEKLEQFEGRSSFVTWLGRIGQNLCFRRREKKEVSAESLEDESGAASLNEASPEQQAMQAEMRRILRAAVSELPEPDQSVLRLRDIENLSAAETAAQLKISVPAVKSRLHRARAQLRAKLNAYFCC